MVTDQQVKRLFRLVQSEPTRGMAAAKAGMSEKTARKYLKSGRLPSKMKKERTWRTRGNPFKKHWEEIVQFLESDATIEAKSLFEYLCRKYAGTYQEGQLRTFQRHVKDWKVREGQPKEVFFAQVHHPGDQAQSDFTNMNELGVTIANQPFPHLLYHFVLTYSNWEWVTICQSESFEALSMGVQDALWRLGAVPTRHKTDNLSAAVKDLQGRKVFTDKYEALMNHYGLAKFTNTPGEANENGDVEQSHRQLVRAMKTEFLLRGSKNFESVEAYRAFLEAVVERRNGNRRTKLLEEMNVMRELPSKRLDDFSLEEARVSQYSTIQVRRNTYSLDSRYIGEKLRVYVYENRLQLWHAGKMVVELERLKGKGKICINYRHMIDSLVKKPGAFRNYKYQEALFPTLIFRATYDWLVQHKEASADREYVNILYLAAKEGQNRVEQVCRKYLYEGKPIAAEGVKGQFSQGEEPQAKVDQVNLTAYDQLLAGGCHD